jgi:hypothetical protein
MEFEKLLKQYEKGVITFNKFVEKEDHEMAHRYEKELYTKFIKDINSNKFKSMEEIKIVSSFLKKKVMNKKFKRWYS